MTPTKFIQSQYLYNSFKETVFPYLTNKKADKTLNVFELPKSMNDFELQNIGSSIPVEVFASVMQQTLKNANKSNWYVVHVKLKDKAVAVRVYWYDDEWYFGEYSLGDDTWREGYLFLSFATVDSETLVDPLTLSDLETAIKICKENGLTVSKIY